MQCRFFGLAILVVLVASSGAQAVVTISSNNLVTGVRSVDGNADASASPTTIDSTTLVDATVGDYFSRLTADYSESGGLTKLSNTLDSKRSGGLSDYNYAYESSLYFTVDADTKYDLSGAFTLTHGDGTTSESSFLYVHTFLDNTTTGDNVYSYNYDVDAADGTYDIEDSWSTSSNVYGDFNGDLLTGQQYRWYFYVVNQAFPSSDSGATLQGDITLEIGDNAGAVVPEPTSLLTLSGLFACFGLAGWRKRRLQAA